MIILSQQIQEVSATYSSLTKVLLVFLHNSNSYWPVHNKLPALSKIQNSFLHFLLHFCAFLKVWASALHHGSIPWQLNTAHTLTDKVYCKHLIQLLRFRSNTKLGYNIQSTDLLLDTHRCYKLQCDTTLIKCHQFFLFHLLKVPLHICLYNLAIAL